MKEMVQDMSKIRIITDSASDISEQDEKELNIKVLNFKVAIGNKSYVSRVDFDNDQFYDMMKQYDGIPSTSQITPFEYEELYMQMYEEGYDELILVMINSEGSATYNNAILGKNNFFDEHPELEDKLNITVFDSRSYSGSYGYPVVKAAQMVKDGVDAQEIKNYIKEKIEKSKIYFGVYELTYAGKSGRIPSAAALVGDVVGIKPVMKIWDHEITTAGKCRGEKKLMANIIKMTENDMVPGSPYSIVYGNDSQLRDELEAKMTEAIGYGPEKIFQIGVAVAANAGPRVVGTIFDAKDV